MDRILELNKKKHSGKLAPSELDCLEREIAATDQEIDERVYELYAVTDEERKAIEGPGGMKGRGNSNDSATPGYDAAGDLTGDGAGTGAPASRGMRKRDWRPRHRTATRQCTVSLSGNSAALRRRPKQKP